MEINGRDVKFRRTVWATCEVAKLCPDEDIGRLSDILTGSYVKTAGTIARTMVILSEADARARVREGDDTTSVPLTLDEIMDLDMDTFSELSTAAMDVWAADGSTTVEVEPVKKTEA